MNPANLILCQLSFIFSHCPATFAPKQFFFMFHCEKEQERINKKRGKFPFTLNEKYIDFYELEKIFLLFITRGKKRENEKMLINSTNNMVMICLLKEPCEHYKHGKLM